MGATSGIVLPSAWCGSDCEEIPHIQGQRRPKKMVGARAVPRVESEREE